MFQEPIEAAAGSYNSLTHQVAYCKMQGYDTVSRASSEGPSVFTSGLVKIGVGLAHNQFGSTADPSWLNLPEGAATCGMCLEVTKVSNMPAIADDLITWDYDRNMTVPFLAMVFDQCTDEICDQSGYLDFDVYSETQPVRKGNPRVMEWRAVDCPVGETHKLEYLVCTPGTCNADDPRSVPNFGAIFNPDFFAVFVRNHRLPVIKVEMEDPDTTAGVPSFRDMPFTSGLGWTWSGKTFQMDEAKDIKIRVTAADGQVSKIPFH
ncbi:hypothetical protein NSK_002095 [Nannochloropsis salina CCMP1776]|uniref:Expansin-like EG45 domain-containing protein n=1 Tax=Nannochloropsis salina CCMP1776 TaxID=1027361 RepID=A0A4D9DCR7_9STRA|nr:hypothetical protein NSK_002095 [Nannochloropsis salina CCMP1776]|eukprot:TFJ86438.1 hypothetical protein NSK_002095 [Nannochloropsis salina CCMP1776]